MSNKRYVHVVLFTVLLLCPSLLGSEPRIKPPPTTQVVLLGTGTPAADPDRSGPSVAVVVNDMPYLVDFGPGVVRRAVAACRKGVKGLDPVNFKRVFVTHLHSDHTVGYPDLIFTPWVLGRSEPLEVYGPKGIEEMTTHILQAYRKDIRIRTHGLERNNITGFRVNAREIRAGVVYRDSNVTVTAFPVRHGEWRAAFGYRFQTADRTIVISGDASPSPAVVENCNGCNVLIHEAYTQASFVTVSPKWQQYRLRYHTSSLQLAEIATRARPGLLILYHQENPGRGQGSTEEQLLHEIRQAYSGAVVSGHDLDIY